jgi:uncharacterized membrane protein YdjX (TVP38/TMEM64 family)
MKFKYPKLFLLIITFILAYFFITQEYFSGIRESISNLGYLGAFIGGILIAYGFTAAIATAIFIIIGETHNIFLIAIIGGIGAFIGDFIIFKIIRHSFHDEIHALANENIIAQAREMLPKWATEYIMPIIAGLIIASPLPDEIGVALLATTNISDKIFTIISFLLNTTGIFMLIYITQTI